MKEDFAQAANEIPIDKTPIHKKTPEAKTPVLARHWILGMVSLVVIYFRRELFPFLPDRELDKNRKIQEKYMLQKRERVEKAILQRIEKEEKLGEEENPKSTSK